MKNLFKPLSSMFLSILVISGCTGTYDKLTAEEWSEEYFMCESSLEKAKNAIETYRYALEEANYKIEDLNYMIEDAQGYAWGDYDEMGEALDRLYTEYTVDDPY